MHVVDTIITLATKTSTTTIKMLVTAAMAATKENESHGNEQ